MSDEQPQEQPSADLTPIFKHVKLVGLKKLTTTINLMDSRICEKCGRTYYMGHLGRGIGNGQKIVKVVEERPGSYERHTYLCKN